MKFDLKDLGYVGGMIVYLLFTIACLEVTKSLGTFLLIGFIVAVTADIVVMVIDKKKNKERKED